MRVLVTDGANRVALAVVRALGKAGAEVVVAEQEPFAQSTPAAFVSRHASRHEILPPLREEGRFIDALAALAAGVDVLLPVSTNVLLACARNRNRFAARLPIPPLATIRRANDKSTVLAAARKTGVPIPVSYAPESDEELDEVIARLRLPAVVKLRDDEGTYLEPSERYRVSLRGDDVRAAWDELHKVRPFPVIQERIEGDGYGVGVLAKEGRVLASFCHRRVREYPITGGPSALCESVRDERLARYAAAVIGELGWTGVAMVEFKKDDDYRLLEINPRFWGSLPLATSCGINFPDLLCRMTMGEEIAPPSEPPAGVKLRFLAMDCAAAWKALLDGDRRGRYLWGFVRDLVDLKVKDGLIDPSDLRAGLVYLSNRL
jgi:predicted ATP-grasp superfamily ATP-dependent carboligase